MGWGIEWGGETSGHAGTGATWDLCGQGASKRVDVGQVGSEQGLGVPAIAIVSWELAGSNFNGISHVTCKVDKMPSIIIIILTSP